MILDVRPVIKRIEGYKDLEDVVGYFDIPKLIEYLTICPEHYECNEIYDYMYDTYGGEMSDDQLNIVSDAIDEVYTTIHDKVMQSIKRKYRNDPYIFHRWVGDSSILVGDAYVVPPWEDT